MRHSLWRLLLGCALVAVACQPAPHKGDAGAADAGSIGTATVNELVNADCERIAACSSILTATAGCDFLLNPPDETASFNSTAAIAALIDEGRIKVDSAQIQACLTDIAALPCDSQVEEYMSLPSCQASFVGQIADGQACIADLSCKPGSFCFQTAVQAGSCAGTCTPLGTDCDSDADCVAGNVCVSNLCAVPADGAGYQGFPCGTDNLCQPGLACQDGSNVCEPESTTAGDSCDVNQNCGQGLYCNASASPWVCATPGGPGGSCADAVAQATCTPGLICVPDTTLMNFTCEQSASKGAPCTDLFQCGGAYSLLMCDPTTNVCVDRPTSGPCPLMGETISCNWQVSYCDATDNCVPYKPVGAPCDSGGECGPAGVCAAATTGGVTVCGGLSCAG